VIANATAVIVAGGAGTRMGGASKAFLEVGGRSILERQLDVLRPLFAQVVVCAPDAAPFAPFALRAVADRFPGKGAPGGVQAALAALAPGTDWAFCVACDMPFLRPEPIELLARHRLDADAVVPVRSGFLEPLFAFYNVRLVTAFSAALQAGNPSLVRLLEGTRLVRVPESELAAVDPGLSALENVNTPEELRRARSRV
jgi:molybdopterin-guanine dinucleotide biosynthesis protein A